MYWGLGTRLVSPDPSTPDQPHPQTPVHQTSLMGVLGSWHEASLVYWGLGVRLVWCTEVSRLIGCRAWRVDLALRPRSAHFHDPWGIIVDLARAAHIHDPWGIIVDLALRPRAAHFHDPWGIIVDLALRPRAAHFHDPWGIIVDLALRPRSSLKAGSQVQVLCEEAH